MATTVIVTRPKGIYVGEDGLVARLEALGFSPRAISSLRVTPLSLSSEARASVREVFDGKDLWISFLSPTAAAVFGEISEREGYDTSQKEIHFSSQGPGTSEAIRTIFMRDVEVESARSTAESFAEAFERSVPRGSRVLVPQSAEGRDIFGPTLAQRGFSVTCVTTYALEQVSPTVDEIEFLERSAPLDSVVLFMSPSAVRATVRALSDPERLKKLRAISIGPSTSAAIRQSGLNLFREAPEHSEAGVIECLLSMRQP
jgi:uroporphyrinogen-III synthase